MIEANRCRDVPLCVAICSGCRDESGVVGGMAGGCQSPLCGWRRRAFRRARRKLRPNISLFRCLCCRLLAVLNGFVLSAVLWPPPARSVLCARSAPRC